MSDLDNENENADVLTTRQQIFVDEYIIDFNAARAARRAGYSPKTAVQAGYRLINDPKIKAAIDKAIADRKERLQIDADRVLAKYIALADADPTELSGVKVVNCRYCFGDNNEYQWTVAEYENASERAVANGDPEPVCSGGVGFNVNGKPNEFCPECQGNGVETVYVSDTEALSAGASMLFESAEHTKFGIKVNIADRSKAMLMLAKHTGLFRDQIDITSGGKEIKSGLGHFYGEEDDESENEGESDT